MKEKAKAEAQRLINQFTFASIYFTNGEQGAKLNAKQCARISVKNTLESLAVYGTLKENTEYHEMSEVLEELNKL